MPLHTSYVPDAVLNALRAIHLESLSRYEVSTAISPHFTGGEAEAWEG